MFQFENCPGNNYGNNSNITKTVAMLVPVSKTDLVTIILTIIIFVIQWLCMYQFQRLNRTKISVPKIVINDVFVRLYVDIETSYSCS